MRHILYSCLLLVSCKLAAQQVKNTVAAPYLGLSAYSATNTDVFAMSNNQAALGFMKQAAVGVFGERRFMMEELNGYSIALALPVQAGAFGIQAERFGFSGFNETQAGLAYGLALSSKLAVGGKINYYSQQISGGYNNASLVNFEAGLLLRLTNKLTAGVQAYNPIGGKFGIDKTEKLASIYKFGLGYDVSDKVFLVAEVSKEEAQPLNVISALHYQFDKRFFAKIGVSTAASNVFAAAGLTLGDRFRLDVFASHHQQLGFSPGLMLLFQFNKKQAQ